MSGEGNSLAQKTRSFATDGAATLHGGLQGLLNLHPSLRLNEKYKSK